MNETENNPGTDKTSHTVGHGQFVVCSCGTVHEDDGDTCTNCGTALRSSQQVQQIQKSDGVQ